jgi:hypothetical protein
MNACIEILAKINELLRSSDDPQLKNSSFDCDNDSGEIIVDWNGKDYIIKVEEIEED